MDQESVIAKVTMVWPPTITMEYLRMTSDGETDPIADSAEKVIEQRAQRLRTLGVEFQQVELSRDIADELTRIRFEMRSIRQRMP